jgi:hypothetical protein
MDGILFKTLSVMYDILLSLVFIKDLNLVIRKETCITDVYFIQNWFVIYSGISNLCLKFNGISIGLALGKVL